MKTSQMFSVLCLFLSINICAQSHYVSVWEGGSGSNLITPPMSWNAFLKKGEEMTKKGLRLDDFEITKKGIVTRYAGSWRSGTGNNIITEGLTWNDFLKKGEELTGKGYRLWDFEILLKGGKRLYIGNWRAATGSNIITGPLTWSSFKKKGEELTAKGYRLWDFEVFKTNKNYYVGNWRSGTGSNIITPGVGWQSFLKKGEELTGKGLRLYDVEVINTPSGKKYVGAWRSGTGSNIIVAPLKWENLIKKGEELTGKGLRLTDFEPVTGPVRAKPGPRPGRGDDRGDDREDTDFPKEPAYVNLLYGTLGGDKYRVIVDFTNMVEGKPQITIPAQFLTELPWYEGKVVFPNNFCGLRIVKASRFVWLDSAGKEHNEFPYNNVPENSSVQELFGSTPYFNGMDFTGPIGKCENGTDNWVFPFPFTQTAPVVSNPLKLVIELESDSAIEFLNFKINPGKPLDPDKLFKPVDFNKIIKYFNKTFYDGFKQWVDVLCEKNPEECPLQE